MRVKAIRAILLTATLPCAVGADEAHHELHIPEPMVFDLVHGLGVRQGAFEANVLALFPLNDTSRRPIEWAPEVEYAVRDNLALEFELAMEDSDLEAYKFAAQFTFGEPRPGRFIHGSQFIVEKFDGEDIWELTGLYLAGYRFNADWSGLAMLGLRTETGDDAAEHDEVLLNLNLFREIGPRVSVGMEADFAFDTDSSDNEVLLAPQLRYELTRVLELQLGAGAEIDDDDTDWFAGFRFIYAR